jgi:class 3 adenylate cyclase
MTTYFSTSADERERRLCAWAVGYRRRVGFDVPGRDPIAAIEAAAKVVGLPPVTVTQAAQALASQDGRQQVRRKSCDGSSAKAGSRRRVGVACLAIGTGAGGTGRVGRNARGDFVNVAHRLYTVNDVAKRIGVSSDAIVLAEKEGRIPAARRDELGARIYDANDMERIEGLMRRR